MPVLDTIALRRVDAVLNYLAPDTNHPGVDMLAATGAPPPPVMCKVTVPIHDLRDAERQPSLDDNGFAYLDAATATRDFFDHHAVSEHYFAECAALVASATGARHVHAFDYNLRDKSLARQANSGVSEPVRFVHNDYTEKSAPQRVRDLFPHGAPGTGRFAFINLWRPIGHAALDIPLAVCDAASLASDDLVPTDLRYAERTGEVYSARFSPGHRWYYRSGLRPDEALLLKCFDSDHDVPARYTAHCAFHDPGAPPGAPPRRSIEVRTIAFFG
jgi:hypothetical protein